MSTLLAVALRSHLIAEPPPISAKTWAGMREVVAEAGSNSSPEEFLLAWADRWLLPGDAAKVRARVATLGE
ncbi:MAG: hypothetical protein C4341_08515, partial [Armatimonadota bacterium]